MGGTMKARILITAVALVNLEWLHRYSSTKLARLVQARSRQASTRNRRCGADFEVSLRRIHRTWRHAHVSQSLVRDCWTTGNSTSLSPPKTPQNRLRRQAGGPFRDASP